MNTMCLIFLDGPAPNAGGSTSAPTVDGAADDVKPLSRSTASVIVATLSPHTSDRSIDWSVPRSRLPMYDGLLPPWLSVGFSTSTPFSPAPRPLALATYSRFPSGVATTADGYHPVGIRTSTEPDATSIAATEFRPPSATYSTRPSGDHVTASGCAPVGPATPKTRRSNVFFVAPVTASRSTTESSFDAVTATVAPSGDTARLDGRLPATTSKPSRGLPMRTFWVTVGLAGLVRS